MRIQRIQQYSIENNKNSSIPRQSVAFRQSRKISDAAESVLGCLFVFFAIFQIPIIAGLMCLKTYYDIEQERKDDIREDEILRQISEVAQPNLVWDRI